LNHRTTLTVIATALAALSSAACGSGDTTPDPNTSTCYRCSLQNAAIIQSTYACTPADAQQFGRPCLR
jgi:hypothetical protein